MTGSEDLQQQLDDIWAASRPEVELRVSAIELAAVALLDGSLEPDRRRDAEREAHKLAGVAGTFGFAEASILAREAEGMLKGDHEIAPNDLVRLSVIALQLRHQLIEGERKPVESSAPPAVRTAGRVLIVDDDPTILAVVAALLQDQGYDVDALNDPTLVRTALAGPPPDLVILDVDMPGMTGVELCREIRREHRWDAVPIVFLTGRSGASVELFDAGADNYLTKPVNAPELISVVRGRMRRRQTPPSGVPIPVQLSAPAVDVVIVDDDAMLVELLGHALRSRGHTVHTIGDGTAALAELAGPNPTVRGRVIVLDVGLPEQDGLAVLRALARDGVTRTSRVIMLTARSLESEVLQALDLGAADHVAKPFSLPVLMHRVRRALDERSTP